MPAPKISDSLWSILEPLLPPPRPRLRGDRPPAPARAALTGIHFVLRSGIADRAELEERGEHQGNRILHFVARIIHHHAVGVGL